MSELVLKANVRVLKGANAGQFYELAAAQTVLGRHSDCGIVLANQTISRQHAQILRGPDGYYVEDLQSLNGTFVNGARVEGRVRLNDGDRIQIHDVLLGFSELNGDRSSESRTWADVLETDASEEPSPRSTSIVTAIDVWHGAEKRVEVNPQVKLRAILEIVRNVGSSLDINEVLPNILNSLFGVFPQADRGYVLLSDESGRLIPRAMNFRAASDSDAQTMAPVSYRIARRALAERKAILSSDSGSAEPLAVGDTIFGVQFRAVMCAPLMGPSGAPLGVIQLGTEETRQPFTEQDLDVLASVAALAGQLVEHAHWHERKRAEEAMAREHAATERERRRLRAVLEVMPVGVLIVDAQGRLIEMNPEARNIWGGEPPRLERVEQYSDYFKAWWPETGEPVGSLEWGLARAVLQGEICTAEEMQIETFDGRRLTILNYALPIQDQAGRTIGGVGVNVDITQRKQVEESIKESDRRKDEFLAMLAHELRNPLAPIANALTLLRADDCDGETTGWGLEMMQRQVEHLVRLVDDLLDVSRIMRGKIQLHKQPLELARIIERAVETAAPLIHAQGHALNVSVPGDKICIEGDRIRLAQVVANLLNNAAKYTPKGGNIELLVEPHPREVAIRVRDNGVGIGPEMLPHIFDLFTQADRSLDRSQGGLGIGLSLVKRLIDMHGGSVQALSEGTGRGCEFVVRLPVSSKQARPESDAWRPSPVASRRVLVVDDQQSQAQIIAKLLIKFWGHQVRMVHNGPAAIEAALSYRPEVILLDIGLPGMSGYDVVRQLRARAEFQQTLIVALSGYGADEDRLLAQQAGFDRHLVKPASAGMLEALFSDPKLAAPASEPAPVAPVKHPA